MKGLRIAVLKPDVGVVGGFEAVVERVEATLRRDGHEVTRISVELGRVGPQPASAADATPESRHYAAAFDVFSQIDTRRYDLVVSTQPPSFAHRHPRHLSLFFHHQRIYYDLEDLWIEAGMADDAEAHRRAGAQVRALDAPALDAVTWFAAGSETVRRRLARFGGIDRTSLFHAGVAVEGPGSRPGPASGDGGAAAPESHGAAERPRRDGPVLTVGRLELPKRQELFVAAMRRLPQVPAAVVGTGGRQAWIGAVDHRLAQPGVDLDALDERALWCCRPPLDVAAPDGWRSSIELAGRVDDATLSHLYATAPCVVAPAYDEDYGLTAIEAMAHGAPVVVCDDGGGLADLVTHEVDGLVVAPTGAAIAAAVERILGDPDLAAGLAEGARATAAATTWSAADDELRAAIALTFEEAERPAAASGLGGRSS